MNPAVLSILYGVLGQAIPEAGGATPPSPAAAPAVQEEPAAAGSSGSSGDPPRVPAPDRAREIEVEELIRQIERERGRPDLDLPALEVIEKEVESLRKTADGLAGNGERTEAEILMAPVVGEELEKLGVSPDRTEDILDLSASVHELRAKLALIQLRGSPDDEPVADLEPIESIAADQPDAERETASDVDGNRREAAAGDLSEALAWPDRVVRLLFLQGDYERLIAAVERAGRDALDAGSLYAYAVALQARSRVDEARAVFEKLAEGDPKTAIASWSARQVERLDQLEVGAVDLPPLEKERGAP